jgi:large subunit ribosomal protein L32
MAQPKKKASRMKRGNRRSHHKATPMSYVKCENCGELKLTHRVCPACGHYGNRKVVETDEL